MRKYLKYLLISFLFITITSKLSPIYPINDWCDTNSFFTMGKAMVRGFSIYKDLFEQKGPLLYFIYGIGYLISNKSFFGVYLLEVISFSVFLRFVDLILDVLKFKYNKLFLVFLSFIITTSLSFYGGGSAEEFCLPFIVYCFYLLFKIFKGLDIGLNEFFINGLFFSFVFFIKFNLISFWFGFFIICLLYYKKNGLLKKILYFILGFLLPLLLFLIYFYYKNNLFDFIDVYFIKNIVNYNSIDISVYSFFDRFFNGFVYLFMINFIDDFLLIIFILFSFVYAYKKNALFQFLLVFIFPFIFICCQHNWQVYYNLPFSVFSIVTLLYLFGRFNFNKFRFSLVLLFIIPLTFVFGKNTFMLKYNKEDYAQYKFYEIIREYDDKSLLNYNFIDSGFYLYTDVVPNVRFFHHMNFIGFNEMDDSLEHSVESGDTNFVVLLSGNNNFDSVSGLILNNYKLLDIERHNKDYGLYYALYVRK